MLRIRMNRDSVAMGDDVDSHEVMWEFPDDAVIGDAIVRTGDEQYLAHVGGDVAWVLGSDSRPNLALLHVDFPSGERWVTALGRGLRDLRLADAAEPDAEGVRALRWRYLSGGARMPWDAFRAWVTEPPERQRERLRRWAEDARRRRSDRMRAAAEARAAKSGDQPG